MGWGDVEDNFEAVVVGLGDRSAEPVPGAVHRQRGRRGANVVPDAGCVAVVGADGWPAGAGVRFEPAGWYQPARGMHATGL